MTGKRYFDFRPVHQRIEQIHRAFTIVEAVATVLALAVLSTMLLPTLADTRRQSKELRCLANLSRIAQASIIHAGADPSGFAIPVHGLVTEEAGSLGEYEWGGKSGIGEPLAGTDRLSSRWGTSAGLGPATRPLNRILYGDVFPNYELNPGALGENWAFDAQVDLDVFRCPADYGYTGHHFSTWRTSKLTSYDHYGNSYNAVSSWVGVQGPNCKLQSNSVFSRPISRVPVPALTLMYMENCGRFAYSANYGDDGCKSLGGREGADVETNVRGWHGQMWTFQAAFVDGHAGVIRMEGHLQPQPRLGAYPDCFYSLDTCHYFWHCVIFRGPGWQIDTLPAPPVKTEIPCNRGVFNNPIE